MLIIVVVVVMVVVMITYRTHSSSGFLPTRQQRPYRYMYMYANQTIHPFIKINGCIVCGQRIGLRPDQ